MPRSARQFHEGHRHQRRIDHRQVVVEHRDERHQVEAGDRSIAVGKLHLDRLHAERPQGRGQLTEPLGVGAVAAPHRQRPLVQPYEIAALGGRFALESRQDGHVQRLQRRRDGRLLAAALDLAHPQDDGAGVGDDHRVVS